MSQIESLLNAGLEAFGHGDEPKAIKLWSQVLALDDNNKAALDYLSAAGIDGTTIPLEQPQPSEMAQAMDEHILDSKILIEHVKERRYEAALHMLYEARAKDPRDTSISKSIQHLKKRLQHYFVEVLGGLDGTPIALPAGNNASLGHDAISSLAFVDGISSFEDIVESSTLGRMRTLKALVVLLRSGAIRARRARKPSNSVARIPKLTPEDRPTTPVQSPQQAAEPDSTRPTSPAAPIHGMLQPSEPEPPTPVDPEQIEFDQKFMEGMRAYVHRKYDTARTCFERCLEIRPDDSRVKINLDRLKKR